MYFLFSFVWVFYTSPSPVGKIAKKKQSERVYFWQHGTVF